MVAVRLIEASDKRSVSHKITRTPLRWPRPGQGRTGTCHDCGQDLPAVQRAGKRSQVPRESGDPIPLLACIARQPQSDVQAIITHMLASWAGTMIVNS
jgi:hypothetical protein